jgi:hypothetical protein
LRRNAKSPPGYCIAAREAVGPAGHPRRRVRPLAIERDVAATGDSVGVERQQEFVGADGSRQRPRGSEVGGVEGNVAGANAYCETATP